MQSFSPQRRKAADIGISRKKVDEKWEMSYPLPNLSLREILQFEVMTTPGRHWECFPKSLHTGILVA